VPLDRRWISSVVHGAPSIRREARAIPPRHRSYPPEDDVASPHPDLFADQLLAWFEANGRDLPWRSSEDPYQLLICEVLLRRSRGTTVARVTDEFFRRWPTPAALSRRRGR
jgi:endonuclease III